MSDLPDTTGDTGWRPRPGGFLSIPPEVVSRILCLLGTRDVVRLRSVSKFFRDITYDAMIWKTIYAKPRLPRYPGPFHTQSASFLERTLVRSEQLVDSWLYRPIRFSSSVEIPPLGPTLPSPLMLNGRWLVLCESPRRFVAYDFDSKPHSKQVLWEKSGPPITFWETHTVLTDEGPVLYIAFNEEGAPAGRTWYWGLLEFRISDDTNSLYHTHTLDIPEVILPLTIPRQIMDLDDSKAPFFYLMREELIFDSRTRLFYKFPEFTSHLVKPPSESGPFSFGSGSTSVLTVKTHVIQIHFFFESTLLQAFVFPADSSSTHDGMGVLQLSHEGLVNKCLENLTLLRNSVVNPTTGSTNIRFLSPSTGDDLFFICIDLTLPQRSDSDSVLSMSIKRSRLDDRVYYEQYNSHPDRMSYFQPSHDGHLRGFYRFTKFDDTGRSNSMRSGCLAVAFEIDASGDRCSASFGNVRPLTPDPFEGETHCMRVYFDGVRGRLCFVKKIRDPATDAGSDDEPVVDEEVYLDDELDRLDDEFYEEEEYDDDDESDDGDRPKVDFSIVVVDVE